MLVRLEDTKRAATSDAPEVTGAVEQPSNAASARPSPVDPVHRFAYNHAPVATLPRTAGTMLLSEFLTPDLILLDLPAGGVDEVLHDMVTRLHDAGLVDAVDPVVDMLRAREAAHTTTLESGVAIPHAMLAGLDNSLLAIAVAPRGTTFGPPELEPVRLFFLLLSPPNEGGLHIKMLARIVRLLRHPGTLDVLVNAPTPEALLAEVERVEAQHV
ncbi:MAG: PTS sugar transporter subunit IIA [Gemmatimonadota bacterium]